MEIIPRKLLLGATCIHHNLTEMKSEKIPNCNEQNVTEHSSPGLLRSGRVRTRSAATILDERLGEVRDRTRTDDPEGL